MWGLNINSAGFTVEPVIILYFWRPFTSQQEIYRLEPENM